MTRAWWLVALPLIAGCLEGTTGADVPPIAVATVGDGACALPGVTEVVLDATGSSGPAGQPLAFAWQFVEVPAGACVTRARDAFGDFVGAQAQARARAGAARERSWRRRRERGRRRGRRAG